MSSFTKPKIHLKKDQLVSVLHYGGEPLSYKYVMNKINKHINPLKNQRKSA